MVFNLCLHPFIRQVCVPPALLTLRASTLESNLANFLVPEICLSEQDFTVVVAFPGVEGLPLRSLLYKSKCKWFPSKTEQQFCIPQPWRVPCLLVMPAAVVMKQLECVGFLNRAFGIWLGSSHLVALLGSSPSHPHGILIPHLEIVSAFISCFSWS
jgi:hypothetical protein